MITNLFLFISLNIVTNTEAYSEEVRPNQRLEIIRSVQYVTNEFVFNNQHIITTASNVVAEIRSGRYFDGVKWNSGPIPAPPTFLETTNYPPLPSGVTPKAPMPRIDTSPAILKVEPLPTAEDLRRAKLWDKHR